MLVARAVPDANDISGNLQGRVTKPALSTFGGSPDFNEGSRSGKKEGQAEEEQLSSIDLKVRNMTRPWERAVPVTGKKYWMELV